MGLNSCPECDYQIDNHTTSCPQCGCPINEKPGIYASNPKKGTSRKIIGIVFMLLGVVAYHNDTFAGGTFVVVGAVIFIWGKIQHGWHWK